MIKKSNIFATGRSASGGKNQKSKIQLKIQELKNIIHLIEAVLANLYYRFPSRKLKVIGVTGTDGKTTTCHLIYHILKSAEKKVSLISTIYAKIGKEEFDTGLHTTTPNPFLVQKLLKKAVDQKDEYFVLETTSHALDQNRVFGVNFMIGVLTNVTHEHLDYHLTYEKYLKTKLKLLKMAKIAVVNQEDQSFKIIKIIKNLNLKIKSYHSKLKILENFPNLTKYNKQNYAAAYSVCKILGLSDEVILKGMKSFNLPKGRLDLVYDKKFKVIIDFAHTPNAFLVLLPEIRKNFLKKSGRLIHVFGSAGLRDFLKRPLMGEISAQYSDIIILTEEDYRTENVNEIIRQIERGINQSKIKNPKLKVYKIPNRQEAINQAVKLAKVNDVIVITGKSHEKSLCRGKIEQPWDEYQAVKKALKIDSF